MSGRIKLMGISILACLALALTIVSAVQVAHAIQRLQQSRHIALTGDVRGIRPWMTIPYVARAYHVPESYLLQSLGIADPTSVRHKTLDLVAAQLHLSTNALIQELQSAILTYREQHPSPSPQAPGHAGVSPPLATQPI